VHTPCGTLSAHAAAVLAEYFRYTDLAAHIRALPEALAVLASPHSALDRTNILAELESGSALDRGGPPVGSLRPSPDCRGRRRTPCLLRLISAASEGPLVQQPSRAEQPADAESESPE
jgi:hypothetical protein